ncbi:hypothetical protein B296_00043884, partial [Ensete ventricosum]
VASADVSHVISTLHSGFVPTDVLGVYDRPPTDPHAILLRKIAELTLFITAVDEDGNWLIVKPKLQHEKMGVEITVAAHDTTGGMKTKISEAAMIAKLGINVYITKAGTPHSLRALRGEVDDAPDDWLGTVICSSKNRIFQNTDGQG